MVVLAASGSCESYSGTSSSSCRNGDCTVTLSGTGTSGDLLERGPTVYQYRILLNEDESADVRVRRKTSGQREDEESSLRVGETAELQGYTVEYVSHTDDTATFEFARRR
nr:hypothetical protein [Nocardiopsis mwathae]